MRLSSLGPIALSFLVAAPAFASDCKVPSGNEDKMRLAKYLRKQTAKHYNDLVFVFMDKDGNYDEDETVHLTLKQDASTAQLPGKILARARRKGKSVHVFHRSSVSAYIIPIALSDMKKKFNPKIECTRAKTNDRIIGAPPENDVGCEVVKLADVKSATILYDQSANSCATFGKYTPQLNKHNGIKTGSKEEADLKVAVQSFNNTFGTDNKLGDFQGTRMPALSKITYADGKNHDIGEAVGGAAKDRTKKKAQTGGDGY